MRYRRFGNTDLQLSELCFGPMRFASKNPDARDDSTRGIRALHAAIESGINAVHSSADYGSQWALDSALAGHPKRHELHHIIKVQTPDYEDDGFDPKVFTDVVEQALRALHAERVAVVQHLQRGPRISKDVVYDAEADGPRVAAMRRVNEGLVETFTRLREQGKVQYLATFPHTIGFAREAIRSGVFAGVVHYYNLLENEAVELFPALEELGLGFIGVRPLLQGMLTDGRVHRASLPAGDKRHEARWNAWYARAAAVREQLEAIGERPESWTAYALRFCLAHPAVATLVTGMNSVEQVHELVAACDGARPPASVPEAIRRVTTSLPEIPKSTLFG